MSGFDIEPERITLFNVGERYLFTHYFERTDLFDALSKYYSTEPPSFDREYDRGLVGNIRLLSKPPSREDDE